LSYKTLKRRLQRKKRAANLKWWADYRKAEADRAFEDWKLINEHLLEINRLEMRG
jgi:hypothetical protein